MKQTVEMNESLFKDFISDKFGARRFYVYLMDHGFPFVFTGKGYDLDQRFRYDSQYDSNKHVYRFTVYGNEDRSVEDAK